MKMPEQIELMQPISIWTSGTRMSLVGVGGDFMYKEFTGAIYGLSLFAIVEALRNGKAKSI